MYEDKEFYVSRCCGAKAYLDERGFSHCKECRGLFTGADLREKEDYPYCKCKRCDKCGKLIKSLEI